MENTMWRQRGRRGIPLLTHLLVLYAGSGLSGPHNVCGRFAFKSKNNSDTSDGPQSEVRPLSLVALRVPV